jgi:hypothetical protein
MMHFIVRKGCMIECGWPPPVEDVCPEALSVAVGAVEPPFPSETSAGPDA